MKYNRWLSGDIPLPLSGDRASGSRKRESPEMHSFLSNLALLAQTGVKMGLSCRFLPGMISICFYKFVRRLRPSASIAIGVRRSSPRKDDALRRRGH
jgi:hypothetical protein